MPQGGQKWGKKKKDLEFSLWLSRLQTQLVSMRDADSIPGLNQWVKNLAVPRAVAYASGAALERRKTTTWSVCPVK